MSRASDRVGKHWPESAIAVMGVIIGAAVLWGIRAPSPSRSSLDLLPAWQAWTTGGFMIAGGVAWLRSIVHWFDELTSMWAWRRSGAGLAAIGWTVYGLAVLGAQPASVTSWGTRLGVAVICWGTIAQSVASERRIRADIARMRERR